MLQQVAWQAGTTMHASAYVRAYGRNPSAGDKMVATGFSMRTYQGLVFTSGTFNNPGQRGQHLSTGHYEPVSSGEPRLASEQEQNLIKDFLSAWEHSNFDKRFVFHC